MFKGWRDGHGVFLEFKELAIYCLCFHWCSQLLLAFSKGTYPCWHHGVIHSVGNPDSSSHHNSEFPVVTGPAVMSSVQKWCSSKAPWVACFAYIFWAWFSSFMSVLSYAQYSSINLLIFSQEIIYTVICKYIFIYVYIEICIFKEIIF